VRAATWALLLIAGCGRLDFESVPGLRGDAGFPNDAVVVGGGTANRVFVTSATFDGNLGGQTGADMKCQTAATMAGLQGTFIAFISTSTSDAISRLAGSRGWLRMDGAPVVDQPAQIASLTMWNPIDLDEHGVVATLSGEPWTGSTMQGMHSPGVTTCSDWTVNTPNTATGGAGLVQASWPSSISGVASECRAFGPLYCFEIGHAAQVTSGGIAGRIVFVSKGLYAGGGVTTLDAMCASEAAAAGLTGTFISAVATTAQGIATRAVPDSRAWRRVDGVEVAAANQLFDGTTLRSYVTQTADGSYVTPSVFTGAFDGVTPSMAGTNCSNWTDTSTAGQGELGLPSVVDSTGFWADYDTVTESCNFVAGVICLQR